MHWLWMAAGALLHDTAVAPATRKWFSEIQQRILPSHQVCKLGLDLVFFVFLIYATSVHWEKWCIVDRPSCVSNIWPHSVFHLDSLDACADNLSVVVLGAKWTCMLALPQKMEGAAITRPLWTLTVEEHRSHYKCVLSAIYNWFIFRLPRTEQKSSAVPLTVTSAALWGLWQTLQGYISVWWWLICPLYKPASTQRTWKWSPEWGTPTLQLPSVMFLSQRIFLTLVPLFLFMSKYQHKIRTSETGTT